MRIELTDKERLILANQYEILSVIKNDESYAQMAETLRAGHKWIYDQFFDSLSENLPEDQAEHVLSILGVFDSLQISYSELDDKTGIDETDLQFLGFDGNNESELLSFANGLIKERRFETVLGEKARNSHMQTTDLYRRMIARWDELGRPRAPYSKEIIQEIIASRIHPDHRQEE